METRLKSLVSQVCSGHDVSGHLETFWNSPPVEFHADCIHAVRESAQAGRHSLREITSGAGHDAVYVSRVTPTAMIFIPCKDGISHNETESAEPAHVGAGASVLLGAILSRDQQPLQQLNHN
jgi:N-carbamoyl-L-amino-acid hydrolase